MIQIITKIPVFVWPLFAILLLGGLRARKISTMPIAVLLLIPSIFFSWSLFSFFGKYATNPVAILFWLLCLMVGGFIGFLHMQRLKLQFDKQKKKVEIPGSWIPLMLSMSIFSSKFSIGMMSSIMPHLNGSLLFLGLELFSTIILGIFAGRGINCFMRYRTSSIDKYLILIALALAPLAGHASEDSVTQAHKPPILTTTAIIEVHEGGQFKGIVLIERGKAPFGKAIPGGKVEYGETVENAVRREMMEEVNLQLNDLRQFHVYSDPTRDFRHHSVEVAHTAKAFQLPIAGDDAAKAFVVKLEDIPWSELAFDHAQVLKDYIEWRNGNESLALPKP